MKLHFSPFNYTHVQTTDNSAPTVRTFALMVVCVVRKLTPENVVQGLHTVHWRV